MKINTSGKNVTGVVTAGGEEISCDAVVSNCDAIRTYRELLGETPQAAKFHKKDYEPACSGVVLYLGLDRRFDQLLHHNFVFSRDPEEEFDYIYKRGEPAPDPSAYVCAPAITNHKWHQKVVKRSTFWYTLPTCVPTTTGRKCYPSTVR